MTVSLSNIIVQKVFNYGLKCSRLITSDGFTSRDFSIDSLHGVFEGVSINAESGRRNILSLGSTMSIAKNLDEYQFKICSEIPSIHDSDPAKLQLQKFRIAIIASFAILVVKLVSSNTDIELRKWNSFATILLKKSSEFVSTLKINENMLKNYDNSHLTETFEFFQVPIQDMEKALANIYQ